MLGVLKLWPMPPMWRHGSYASRSEAQVIEFLSKLFDGRDFPARWHCGLWTDGHGWLHIVSDLAIFGAYMAIPCLLAYALHKRGELPRPFPRILVLFIGFILLCGLTHLNEAIIFWEPVYRWAGVTKAATATISWTTVLALVPALPTFFALRTPESLEREVKQKTQDLRKTEAQFRDLYDNAPDMYASVDAVTERIVRCNQTAADRLGYAKEELLGMNVKAIYHPRCHSRVDEVLARFRNGGKVENVELVLRTRHGETLDVSLSVTAVVDEHGNVVHSRSAWRDITDRKHAEALFERAVEASPSGMIVVNAEGKIALANSALEKLFGYARAELVGRPVEVLLPARLRDKHPALRDAFLKSPVARQMGIGRDLSAARKDGTEFPIEIGLNPVETPEGSIVVASVIDITERKKHEREQYQHMAELERANRDLDDFAYMASHDLRTPLEGIKNLAAWIAEDNADVLPEASQRHLRQMKQRVDRLDRLLQDLLQYSRAGRIDTELSEVDTNALVRETVDLLDPPRGFRVSTVGTLPVLRTARAPLLQVTSNLINNAIKHHDRDEGTVEVSCCENAQVSTSSPIADDGPGIAIEYHEQIFRMFETLKPRDEVEGSGMGLAIIKKIVERYAGRVTVESGDANAGRRFRFSWPKHIDDSDRRTRAQAMTTDPVTILAG